MHVVAVHLCAQRRNGGVTAPPDAVHSATAQWRRMRHAAHAVEISVVTVAKFLDVSDKIQWNFIWQWALGHFFFDKSFYDKYCVF